MKRSVFVGAIAAAASGLTYAAYRKELRAAHLRILTGRRVIESSYGPIEYAESGSGPAVLFIHGAGGGFDQGLDVARIFLGDGYRVIAPSRFGYLGTPLPPDASAERQADAHLRVLDALHIDRAPVIAISAGAPSAMQLCLRHPDRCSALVLLVPLAYAPNRHGDERLSPFFKSILGAIVSSDFVFWTAMKTARSTLIKSILGTPIDDYRTASPEVRRSVDDTLKNILPISRRADGIWNDGEVANNLTRYKLEDLRTPALVISAADCLYNTYESALYTAEQIHGKFVGYPTGGHLLVGHDAEVRSKVSAFVREHVQPPAAARMEELVGSTP